MKKIKSSHSSLPVAPSVMLLLSSCARRVGGIILVIVALLVLTSGATAQGIFDFGATAPVPGTYDISQLDSVAGSGPSGLNYYVDNGTPPGQTFTTGTTPPTPSGYRLTSLYIQHQAGSGSPAAQPYTLRIYSVVGSAATLLSTYVSINNLTLVNGNWIQWTGLTNILNTNTTYGFSLRACFENRDFQL